MPSIENRNQPHLRHSIASGFVAQTFEMATLGHIFDRIKVEQQSNPKISSIREAVHHMYNIGGTGEIYKGFQWSLITGVSKGTTRWGGYSGFYQLYEKTFPKPLQQKYPSLVSTSVGMSAAFLNTTFVNCPLDNLRTREMTANGSKDSLKDAIRRDGLSFFFRGWSQTILKQTLSLSTYLVAFEKIKQRVQKYNDGSQASLSQKIAVSSSAGAISCLIHTPFDMMKTQAQKSSPLCEKKLIPAARMLYKEYGLAGFYSSLNVKILRSSWHAGATLAIMDYLNALPNQMKV